MVLRVIAAGVAPLLASCALLLDTSGLTGSSASDDGGGSPDGAASDAAVVVEGQAPPSTTCEDGGAAPPECLAQIIPAKGLIVWLRADDGVETSDDGHVKAWRDGAPKLRPGLVGNDATQTDVARQPRRITEATGPVIVFDEAQTLELPPGFEDFTGGLTLFTAAWPRLNAGGSTGILFALGMPPQQNDCGRTGELSFDAFSADFRVENVVVGATGIIDGRGWDVVSLVRPGQSSCAVEEAITIRRGVEIKGTGKMYPLAKMIRSGARVGQSNYFPNEFYGGKLGELLLYDRALDDGEIARVTGYLLRRWPRP